MPSDAGLDIISSLYGTNAYGCACIYKVANTQGHILRHVTDDAIHREEHIARKTTLAHLAIEVHLEVKVLHVATQLLERHKLIRQGSRVVKALAELPR